MDNEKSNDAIYASMVGTCILSVIGSIFVISAYILFKELRAFAFKLVAYLAFADMCSALVYMIPWKVSDPLCQFQASVSLYFDLSGVLWSNIIAHALYSAVIRHKPIELYHTKYLIYAFTIPIIPAVIPFISNDYGSSGAWCWISGTSVYQNLEKYFLFYIPMWFVLIYNAVVYLKVIRKIKNEADIGSRENKLKRKLVRKLKLYPIIFLICQVPVTIYRVWGTIKELDWTDYDPDDSFWILWIAAVSMCSNGALNSIAYGLTGVVKKKLREVICRRKKNPLEDSMMYDIVKEEI
ncbi:unnamed protein product [Blepharisma stoltei]|uniref:G-protein coupled receptors family 2 profile 2 domain-containing protein n=1 Tax=Blepharisma stoltei TaxID=1481888 RepID=A0AAU9JTA1_9CILI|nr:unnamed protein product [Blepharisma stoltei]